MPRILLAALAGLAVLVVPAIAVGDSSKSPSSDVRIVRQAEPSAVLPSQPGEDDAKPASVTDLETRTAAREDEPGGVSNDDVTSDSVGDVPANLNDTQEDIGDAEDGPVNDVDEGDG